jgi:dienelactone hydrolase
MTRWTALLLVALLPTLAPAQTHVPDPVFDVPALTATPLNPKTLKTSEKDGIVTEEVMFHSEMDGDKSVDIFAFLVYPKGAKNLPAFIWNQGGLSQAGTYHIETYGAKRGYVGMCIDFPLPHYRSTGGYPINSGLEITPDPKKAPIYHGAVALLKAVSYLQSRPEVDKEKIGMGGTSWGGFYTTMMIGIDPRLKVGSAMFGCGFLEEGNAWWGAAGTLGWRGPADTTHWLSTLDPGPRLKRNKTPIGWFTGTNDMFYWMPALMKCVDADAGPKHLALLPNWAHSLTPNIDEEVFEFFDIHLKGKPALLGVTPLKIETKEGKASATWTFSGLRTPASANVILSYGEPGNWTSRYWLTLPAKIDGNNITASLPVSGLPYFVSGSIIDADKFVTSTPLVLVPATPGASEKIEYDGASDWGGFEPAGVFYQVAHGFMSPTVSKDAKEGTQSDELKPGKTRVYPLYFTAGVAHRLSLYLKGDKAAEVVVQLIGNYDGKPEVAEKKAQVGTDWTQVTLDAHPPKGLKIGTMSVDITVPAGTKVLLDDVTFKPVQ